MCPYIYYFLEFFSRGYGHITDYISLQILRGYVYSFCQVFKLHLRTVIKVCAGSCWNPIATIFTLAIIFGFGKKEIGFKTGTEIGPWFWSPISKPNFGRTLLPLWVCVVGDHQFKTSACLRGGGVSPCANCPKVTVHKDKKSPS